MTQGGGLEHGYGCGMGHIRRGVRIREAGAAVLFAQEERDTCPERGPGSMLGNSVSPGFKRSSGTQNVAGSDGHTCVGTKSVSVFSTRSPSRALV